MLFDEEVCQGEVTDDEGNVAVLTDAQAQRNHGGGKQEHDCREPLEKRYLFCTHGLQPFGGGVDCGLLNQAVDFFPFRLG